MNRVTEIKKVQTKESSRSKPRPSEATVHTSSTLNINESRVKPKLINNFPKRLTSPAQHNISQHSINKS